MIFFKFYLFWVNLAQIFLFHSRTYKLFISDQIIRRHQDTLDKRNAEGDKMFINIQTFLVQDPDNGETVTPCMDVYKEKLNLMEVLTS